MFPKIGVPQNAWFWYGQSLLKWMIWGYQYCRKPPYTHKRNISLGVRTFSNGSRTKPSRLQMYPKLLTKSDDSKRAGEVTWLPNESTNRGTVLKTTGIWWWWWWFPDELIETNEEKNSDMYFFFETYCRYLQHLLTYINHIHVKLDKPVTWVL